MVFNPYEFGNRDVTKLEISVMGASVNDLKNKLCSCFKSDIFRHYEDQLLNLFLIALIHLKKQQLKLNPMY